MIIAVDGPAGAGKGAVCDILAKKLGVLNYSSGEVVRLCAFLLYINKYPNEIKNLVDAAQENLDILANLKVKNILQIVDFIQDKTIQFEFSHNPTENKILIRGFNIRPFLFVNLISSLASLTAKEYTLETIEIIIKISEFIDRDFLCEGRNISGYVFPKAEFKFYIDASVEIRAKRRQIQLQEKGTEISFETVLQETIQRDKLDSEREIAPLTKNPDAIYMDTTNLDIESVVELMYKIISTK